MKLQLLGNYLSIFGGLTRRHFLRSGEEGGRKHFFKVVLKFKRSREGEKPGQGCHFEREWGETKVGVKKMEMLAKTMVCLSFFHGTFWECT